MSLPNPKMQPSRFTLILIHRSVGRQKQSMTTQVQYSPPRYYTYIAKITFTSHEIGATQILKCFGNHILQCTYEYVTIWLLVLRIA